MGERFDFRDRIIEMIVGLERDAASRRVCAQGREEGWTSDRTESERVIEQDIAEREIRRAVVGIPDERVCKILGKHLDWLSAGRRR